MSMSDMEDMQPSTSTSTFSGAEHGQGQDKKPTKRKRKTSDAGSASAGDKPHVCDWEGCGKRYSRIDHLSRHRLNHETSTVYTCDRCSKTFVRSDLLIRHVERHEKREAQENEAARTGHRMTQAQRLTTPGNLTGVTVTSLSHPAPPAASTSSSTPGGPPLPNGAHHILHPDAATAFRQPALPTPRIKQTSSDHVSSVPSTSSLDSGPSPHFTSQSPHYPPAQVPVPPTWAEQSALQHAYWNLANPPQVSPFVVANPSQQAPVQGFSPLSAISTFSPHSYSSPHGSNPSPRDQQDGSASGNLAVPQNQVKSPFSAAAAAAAVAGTSSGVTNGSGSSSGGTNNSNGAAGQPLGPDPANSGFDPSLFSFEDSFQFVQASYGAPFVSASEYDWLFDASKDFNFQLGTSRPVSPRNGNSAGTAMTPSTTKEFEDALRQFNQSTPMPSTAPAKDVAPLPRETLVDYRDGPTMPSRPTHGGADALDRSVYFDNETRNRVVNYLGPQWHYLLDDPRMSCDKLREYLELFFTRVYDTQAPVIHRATFDTRTAATPLLLSMALLGCYFSSAECHNLSAQIHPHFRSLVISSADFKPRAELWVHQAVLLIIMYGKLCSNRPAHEMAHIFWSSVVTLGRRSALYSQRPPSTVAKPDDGRSLWAAWIEEETAKRVAHVGFAIDVEHAALFRHSPTLSAFQIQLTLPCDEEEWEAPTAEDWLRVHARSKPPLPFVSALKASLVPGHSPPSLNPFSRITILHGLMSVAQDLQWRDHVIGLSAPDGRANNWRDMISAAYNAWKSRLDQCLVDANFPTSQLLRASISLYAVAHITLSIDIHELQIFAGAESALGLLVSKQVYEGTVARVNSWSQTKDGRMSAWHSAHFIRSSLQHHFHSTTDLAGCLVHRWVVYMATLCVYCYVVGTTGKAGPRRSNHREATMQYLDRMCTSTPSELPHVANKQDCLCLLETVYEYISMSRWSVTLEGANILKKLIRGTTAK